MLRQTNQKSVTTKSTVLRNADTASAGPFIGLDLSGFLFSNILLKWMKPVQPRGIHARKKPFFHLNKNMFKLDDNLYTLEDTAGKSLPN